MPRLTKIYTRKGDEGETSLGSGRSIHKDSLRVNAYGTVDELNSVLGVAVAHGLTPRLDPVIRLIQNELFHLGSDLCFLEEEKIEYKIPQIEPRHVEALENQIDEIMDTVGPLENFVLPGGTLTAAQLHVARTVCRRAERDVIALARVEPVGDHVIKYLNRLSDALFAMARYENKENGVNEPLWDSKL